LRVVYRRYMSLSKPSRAQKKIPKVGTTRLNQQLQSLKCLIRFTCLDEMTRLPQPNCAS
jgi:hypothetical protein